MSGKDKLYYNRYCCVGPSFNFDSSWLGAVHALEIAANLVSEGTVEAAMVTTANIINLNSVDKEYDIMNFLSPDGNCRPFDAQGNF